MITPGDLREAIALGAMGGTLLMLLAYGVFEYLRRERLNRRLRHCTERQIEEYREMGLL